MSLFQKAMETYDNMGHLVGVFQEGKEVLAPVAHLISTVKIEITINQKGDFIRAKRIEEKVPIPCTEKSSGRTSAAVAHPLCDNLNYVAEIDTEKHKLYLEELGKWAESKYSSLKVDAIFKYLKKGTVLANLLNSGLIEKDENGKIKNDKDIVTWRIEGNSESSGAVYEDIELMKQYQDYYLATMKSEIGICMVSGENQFLSSQHLKGVSNISGNAKIISANDNVNFTYRGRFFNDAEALSVGYISSQKAHNTIKWLISNDSVQVGDKKIICWNPKGIKLPSINSPLSINTKDSKAKPTNYKDKLREVILGYRCELPEYENVIIAAFEAATPGRLSISYYNELQGSDFLERLYYWDSTCCWTNNFWGTGSPSLHKVVNFAFGTQRGNEKNAKVETDLKIYGQQMQRLIECRVNKSMFPIDIMRCIVSKANNLQIYTDENKENLLFTACAVIKKCRLDNYKEVWKMALEKDKRDRSYQYGRLLAVLEKIERDTYGKEEERETNAIRSQAYYVQRPQMAFSQIMTQLKTGYYPKLSVGARVFYDKLIGEIMEIISEVSGSDMGKPLTETYLLGYYLQKNELWTKKDRDESEEE